MKYDFAVKRQFEKLLNNTVCGKQLNEYQLDCIKRYMQYCYEAGHAQGYADCLYEDQSHDNDSDNPDNMGSDVKFIDDICEALNS